MHRTGSGIPFFHSTLVTRHSFCLRPAKLERFPATVPAFEIAGWDGSSQWRWTLYAAYAVNNKNLADSRVHTGTNKTV